MVCEVDEIVAEFLFGKTSASLFSLLVLLLVVVTELAETEAIPMLAPSNPPISEIPATIHCFPALYIL
ncbi:hypothetical protein EFM02_02350 [Fructilactobacillus fructivorans]|nr:hypothetical protein [Fructilactobacillus fructivorans]MCT2868951.1 hypothetical protein [Fructilactobacillus fructivorans]MCT2873330.1 hypothetical protein [Fructilactobacillus fructivorans]